MGVISADVTVTPNGEGISVAHRPGAAHRGRPGLREEVRRRDDPRVQSEEWSSPPAAPSRIETPGKPTSINGTALARPSRGAARTETLEAEVKVKVPADRRQARVTDGRADRRRHGQGTGGGRRLAGGRARMKKVSRGAQVRRRHARAGSRDARHHGVPRGGVRLPGRAPAHGQINRDGKGMTVEIDQIQAAQRPPRLRQEDRRRRDQHRAERGVDRPGRRATST